MRAIIMLLFATTGCASLAMLAPQYPSYDIQLRDVERPASARERYGEYVLASSLDSGVTRYTFEDAMVKIGFLPTSTRLHFELLNKTDHSMRIVWNEAAFVDPAGTSHPVMHVGIRYNDCTGPKTPSVVIRRGSLSDVVIPCGNVRFGYRDWIIDPFLPSPPMTLANADSATAALHREVVGKTVQLLLPIRIEDVVNEYLFTFEVKGVTASSP